MFINFIYKNRLSYISAFPMKCSVHNGEEEIAQNSQLIKERTGIRRFITLKGCVLLSIPVYLVCIAITLFHFTPSTTVPQLISASTVCTAGNIGFVGLIIPNMVKMAVGENYRKVLPISAYFGSVLLMFADVVSRLVNWPSETPIGTITSIIGIPVFLYLINARHSKGSL